jgi:hypothetical protein
MTEYNIKRYRGVGSIMPAPTGSLSATLKKYMSYERQGKEFMPNPAWAIVNLYNTKKGTFPWGFRKLVETIMQVGRYK